MTTNSSRLTAGSLAAAAVAVLAAANPAVGTSHPANDAGCSFDPASLPQTADAVDGWYDQCRSQQDHATLTSLPSTPDAIEGWYALSRAPQGPRPTGTRQDYTSWLTNPLTAPWTDRAGHQADLTGGAHVRLQE